nr:hypothetical protein [Fulvimarina pelagi]
MVMVTADGERNGASLNRALSFGTTKTIHLLGWVVVLLAVLAQLAGPTAAAMVAALYFACGLPHGASNEQRASLSAFAPLEIVAYVVTGMAAAAFIFAEPVAGLILFLALSAWHFASDRRDHTLVTGVGIALLLVGGSALFRRSATADVFASLIGTTVPNPVMSIIAAAGALGCLLALHTVWKEPRARNLALTAIGAPLLLDPVLAVGLLFLLFHAGPAQIEQVRNFGLRAVRHAAGWPSIAALAIAIAGCLLVAYGGLPMPILAAIFGGMTVPHMLTLRL